MAYAHQKNVIHRDLKPSNVMVGEFGEVLVLDWGLAKKLGEDAAVSPANGTGSPASPGHASDRALSRAGTAMGTCAYMSPEQAQGRHDLVNQRTDVFALGSILCEVLTLAPAYSSDATDVERRQEDEYAMAAGGRLDDARRRLSACGADPALVRIAEACLSTRPQDRPADAGAVADRVSRHLAAVEQRVQEARVEAETAHVRARAATQRQRLVAALAGVVIVGLAAALWQWRTADAARSEFNQLAGVVLYGARSRRRRSCTPRGLRRSTRWSSG